MMDFISLLMIASFIGTILWIVQNLLKPITQKYFSQTWHYYTGLIPAFFLFGGSVLLNRLFTLVLPVFSERQNIPVTGTNVEPYAPVTPLEQTAANVSMWMTQWFDELRRFLHTSEFVLAVTVIWGVGTTAFIVLHVYRYRAFKQLILQDSRAFHAQQCPVTVVVSPHATTPLLMGLWQPIVILPNISLGEKELTLILSHELVHLKRGDLVVKLIVFAANAIHWFNPAAYTLNKQISMYCELSCDEKVVQHMDAAGRRTYGEMLLAMLEYGVMKRNVICTNSLCNPKKQVKRRLINLMNEKKMKKPVFVLSLVAAITLAGGGGAAAYAATASKIPTGNQDAGYNIFVEQPDGTIEYFDKEGNRVPVKSKDSIPTKKLTTGEIVDRIKKHIEKGLPVPQGYIDELPQKNVDAINKSYNLNLQKTNKN